jgi:ABC-type polysaccharide/polyol phosphate transport system ATPase subunit
MPAIQITALSKTYRVWQRPQDMIIEALTPRRRHSEFRSLNNISFDVPRGSVVGIMGRNGAGKSTLLRIVAGTLDASGGKVEVNGRIAAILELGTGFHPEYTGRENIFLGGMCLGLTRAQIEGRFDDIVAFAEIGEFIDQPFRTYSSGMQARLTFSVATSIDPDVLIIDEALAVGDARFQLKSFDRVREFKKRGKSILLVSHDIGQIVSICDRAILLEKGEIVADGDPSEVGNLYHEMLFGSRTRAANFPIIEEVPPADAPVAPEPETPAAGKTDGADDHVPASSREHRYGDGAAGIVSAAVLDAAGRSVSELRSLQDYRLVCRIRATRPVSDLCLGILLRDKRGIDLFGWDMRTGGYEPIGPLAPGDETEITLNFKANVAAGIYFLTLALARWDGHKHDVRFDAHEIRVAHSDNIYMTSLVNLDPKLD